MGSKKIHFKISGTSGAYFGSFLKVATNTETTVKNAYTDKTA